MYPPELIPRDNYTRIKTAKLDAGYFFIHSINYNSNIEDIIEELNQTDDEKKKVQLIKDLRNEVKDILQGTSVNRYFNLSVNLFGVFRIEHIKFELIGDFKKYGVSSWTGGYSPIPPGSDDYTENTNKYPGWFPFDKVHEFPIEKSSGDNRNFNFKCLVEHRPTNCNFWHFQFEWLDTNTNKRILEDEKGKIRIPNTVKTYTRILVSELIEINVDERKLKVIPEESYC